MWPLRDSVLKTESRSDNLRARESTDRMGYALTARAAHKQIQTQTCPQSGHSTHCLPTPAIVLSTSRDPDTACPGYVWANLSPRPPHSRAPDISEQNRNRVDPRRREAL